MAINVHVLQNIVQDFVPIVENAYKNLAANGKLYEYFPEFKSNSAGKFIVQQALARINDGDSLMALEFLTRAVAAGENYTDELAKFYAHRARFLKDANHSKEAGEDIQRALECFIVDEETESFINSIRQEPQNTSENNEPIPAAQPPHIPCYEANPLFPCSTIHIRIEDGETKGRKGKRVVAISRLFISENIVVEKPLVITPTTNVLSFCHHCLLFSVNPIPCSSCRRVAFCGEVCKEFAWRRYHKYECDLQYILEENPYQHRLAVKIALSFHDYIDSRADNLHCPEEYKNLLNLEFDLEDISDQTKDDFASFTAQLFHGLGENTTFFTDIVNPYKHDIFKGLLMKFMLIVDEYKQDAVRSYKYFSKSAVEKFTVNYIAIYPFAKHFRTGCSPNVSVSHGEASMIIKPLRVIKPGEELFIPGTCHYTIDSKEERQAIFQRKYSATCECEACKNNWPLCKELDRHHDSAVVFNLYLMALGLAVASPLGIYAEHSHALAKEHIGIFLVGPSLEYFSWQYLLRDLHQHFSASRDGVLHFMRKISTSRASSARE